MKSNEADMKRSAVWVISVLSGLLLTLAAALVWLENNKFGTESLLNDARAKISELEQKNSEITARLIARDAKIVRLQSQSQPVATVQDTARSTDNQEQDALYARVKSAEAEAERARQAAEVAQRELKHAVDQSGKLERIHKARLVQVEKEKDEAQKAARNTDHRGIANVVALKKELSSTLQQLTAANAQLLTLRSGAQAEKDSPVSTPPPVPPPVRPLSSSPVRHPVLNAIFGQVKAVETANQFVLIQLNMIENVSAGDALAVTRRGIPVGILRVYRVGPQNMVFTTLTPDLRGKVRVGDQVNLQR